MQKFKFQPKNLKSKRILTEEETKVKPNPSLIIKNTIKEKHNTATLSNTGSTSVSKYDNIIIDMLKLHSDKTKSREVSPCQSNKSNIQISSHFRSKSKSMNEDNKANFLLAITSPKIALVNLDLNKAESSEFSLLDDKKKQNTNTSKLILNKGNHHKRNSFSNTEDDLSKILSKKLSEASQNLQSNPSNKYSKIESKFLNVLNNEKNTQKIKPKAVLPIKVNNGSTPINQNSKNLKNLKVLKIPIKRKSSQNLNLPIEIKKISSTKLHNNIIKPSKFNVLTPQCKNKEIFLVSNSNNVIEKDKLKIVSINLSGDTQGKEKISRNIVKNKENDKFTVVNKSSSSDQQDSKLFALIKKPQKKNPFVPTVKTVLYDLENTTNNSFITNNNDSIIQSVNSLVDNNHKITKNSKTSRSFTQKIKDKLLSNSFSNCSNKEYDINISNVEYPEQGKFSFAKKNKKLSSDNNDKQSIININNIINIFSTQEAKDIFEQISTNKDIIESFETKPRTSFKLKEARRIRSESKNNRPKSDMLYNNEIINNLIVLQKQCNDQKSTGSKNKINDKVDIETMKKTTSPNKLLEKLREKVKIVKEQQM